MDRPSAPGIAAAAAAAWVAAASAALAAAESTPLASGTPVLMALEHHVSSAYTPAGGDIRLRVAEDVLVNDRVLIRRGTPVRGRLRQASDRAMLGTSASMTLGVDFVTAVDGQELRVVAAETRQGRDRGNALAGWTMLWGLPGLVTRGVHSFALRGSLLEAQILFSRRIAEAPVAPDDGNLAAAAVTATVVKHRFSRSHAEPYRLNLEREQDLGRVEFQLQWPEAPAAAGTGWRAGLVAADGETLTQPPEALEASRDRVVFDGWSVLQYCLEGTTRLRFRIESPDGLATELEYPLTVTLTHRK